MVEWVRTASSLAVISFTLVLGTGCGGKQPDTTARTQAEQELAQLRQDNAELRQLQDENQELPRLRRDNEELKRLSEQTRDIEQLRRENEQLRSQLQSLKPARPQSPLRR